MRKFPILGILLLIPAFSLFTFVGCNKTVEKNKDGKPDVEDNNAGKSDKKEITTATTGTIKGTVKIKGELPDMKEDPRIKEHKEANYCFEQGRKASETNVIKQLWIVDKENHGVANVVVSLEPPSDKKYKITDELLAPFKEKKVVMDQPYCEFIPHVAAVYEKIQKFEVRNSAKVTHNTKIVGSNNTETNKVLAPRKEPTDPVPHFDLTFKYAKEPLNVACDMHGWMNAKIAVFNHPYFAVTDKDGAFEIRNVPVDTELTVYMWHESMDKKAQQKKMPFNKGENKLDLEISAK